MAIAMMTGTIEQAPSTAELEAIRLAAEIMLERHQRPLRQIWVRREDDGELVWLDVNQIEDWQEDEPETVINGTIVDVEWSIDGIAYAIVETGI